MKDETPAVETQAVVTDEADKRSEPRPKVNHQGLVVFTGQENGLKCDIIDLTDAGAKLRLADDVTVPSCFELTILPGDTVKTAQVCWRDECELGIQFIAKD